MNLPPILRSFTSSIVGTVGANLSSASIAAVQVVARNALAATNWFLQGMLGPPERDESRNLSWVRVKLLIATGCHQPNPPNGKLSLLHWAAENGHIETVEVLIAARTNLEVTNASGLTPLHKAVINGHTQIVNLLLAAGANKEVTHPESGLTALHWAALEGQTEILKILLAAGAKIDAKDKCNSIPLHWAAKEGHTEAVQVLLDSNPAVNEPYLDGACLWAAKRGAIAAARLLLERGANLNFEALPINQQDTIRLLLAGYDRSDS